MSKVVVIGATGYAGGRISAELLTRGHEVVGVSRSGAGLDERVTPAQGSVHDSGFLREVTAGADHVVVAVKAAAVEPGGPTLLDALPGLTEAAVAQGARLGFVGGAGSLLVAEGGPTLVSTPAFPQAYAREALDHAAVLEALRQAPRELDWFYVSPAATYGAWNAGERTGAFRVGGDVLMSDEAGVSAISGDDFAIAYVDELESGAHPRQRISVAY
ncbi:NAD(P)-dependent oxidoreductase [Pseudokineococcus marinus]|uniref:NAD(P)H-binding protein n=1 Tax=Pseudokineococcus marinus TaxID=351215 RepID=A0A849BQN6_9ACTN|nr:NAD(P)H-binding protein [Pseudokineococcus marinus]NNH21856.1 NAD(P)H-binding protein [Pseudokineococcus marinus]